MENITNKKNMEITMNLRKSIKIIPIYIAILSSNTFASSIEPEFDKSEIPIDITIHLYKNKNEVLESYKKWTKTNTEKEYNISNSGNGWSEWTGKNRCAIHAIKPDSNSKNPKMTSLAKETLHCIYGKYHE